MFYLFLADGFEETEALAPLDILRRCEIETITVGVGSKEITGAHGITVRADIKDSELQIKNCKGIILPGGMPGTKNLAASKIVTDAVKQTASAGGLLCAICAAPSVLGELGLLCGRIATCFPGFEDKLPGATIVNEPAVKSENVITARGAGAALEFGFLIAEQIKGTEFVEKLRKNMQCAQ